MSELQKRIARLGRRESNGIGFSATTREKPRQLLLGVIAGDDAGAKAAADAGADVVLVEASSAAAAVPVVSSLKGSKAVAGVLLPALDEAGAEALTGAGCDFVVCTLEGTEATAVDTDRMGHVAVASSALDDTTLRSLAPLGLDGLYVTRTPGNMTLATQLQLVRIASFASAPLLVNVAADAPVAELRALRDGGAAMVIAPRGTAPEQLAALGEALKNVPAKKGGRGDSRDIALVPSRAAAPAEHDHEEEGDDDDD
ncbi:MAG: hypothetical protein IPG47_05685 [Thermoflexaceae bacterium]|nr:hypothetical protein [Thermoflexaceae bacterium]